MATINEKYITMQDILSKAGTVPTKLINMTSQMNPMLSDAPAFECNMGTYHRVTLQKGLGKFVWGKAYQGVPTSKGRIEEKDFTTGYLENELEVACKTIDQIENYVRFAAMRGQTKRDAIGLAQSNAINRTQAQLSETLAQGVANALFYEDERNDPKRITGFTPFYDSKSGETASQLIDAGGKRTDVECTSLWMLTWDEEANHLIYPAGEKSHGGLKLGPLNKSFNIDMDPTSDGYLGKYDTYRKNLSWHTGVVSADFRYAVRVAGIKVAELSKGKADPLTGPDLIDLMTDGYYVHRGRRMLMGKTCWYGNTTMVKYLDFQARNSQKNLDLFLHQTGPNAKEVLAFRGAPIKESDALHNHETGLAA